MSFQCLIFGQIWKFAVFHYSLKLQLGRPLEVKNMSILLEVRAILLMTLNVAKSTKKILAVTLAGSQLVSKWL